MMKSALSGMMMFFVAQTATAGIYESLTPAQQSAIQRGEQVFVTKDAPGSDWPKAWVYQRVDSTPEEAAAVIMDYELQKTYCPNIIKSKISKVISKNTVDIDYTMKVPVLADEDYTVRDVITSYDKGASYSIDWTLVRADSVRASVGFIRFEPLGTGTIMAYYNFVTPGRSGAGSMKGKAMKQVSETGSAFVRQIMKERTSNQALLQKQIAALRKALD